MIVRDELPQRSWMVRSKSWLGAAVVACSLVVGQPAPAQEASPPHGVPSVVFGKQDKSGNTETISGIRINYDRSIPVSVTIGAAVIDHRGGDGLDAARITLSDIVVNIAGRQDLRIEIPKIELTNVNGPALGATTLGTNFKPGKLPAALVWLSSLNVERIDVDKLVVSYGDKSRPIFDTLSAIRVEAVRSGSVKLIDIGKLEETVDDKLVGSGPARITELDINPVLAWLDDDIAAAAPAGLKTVMKQAFVDWSVPPYTAQRAKAAASVKLTGTDYAVAPPSVAPSRIFEMIRQIVQRGYVDQSLEADLVPLIKSLANAVSIGSIEATDFNGNDEDGQPVSFDIARIENLSPTGVGEARFGGLKGKDATNADVSIGSFAVRGFKILAAERLAPFFTEGGHTTFRPTDIPQFRLGAIAIVDVAVNGKDGPLSIAGVTADMPEWRGYLPTVITSKMERFVIPFSFMEKQDDFDENRRTFIEAMRGLGLNELTLGASSTWRWDDKTQTLSLGPETYTIDGVGGATYGLTFGNISPLVFDRPDSGFYSLIGANFAGAHASLQLSPKATEALLARSREIGLDPVAGAAKVVENLRSSEVARLFTDNDLANIRTQIETFLRDPRGLSVRIDTKQPIPFISLGVLAKGDTASLAALRDLMTITVKANP